MCQTKAEGGKRCAAHMSGSTATVTMTSILTDTQEPVVRSVFTDLRKEGKKLPAPTPEEVYAHAENNAMMARFDPSIPDSRRKKLVEKWEKAKSETPDGGTFHAWRHTLGETFRRGRKILSAVGIAGTLVFTSSCASAGALSPSSPSASPSPSISVSQTATPSPSATASAPTLPAGVIAKGVANDGKGNYLQTTIADSDPAMKYDPALADAASKAHFSAADLAEAQKVGVKFIAEEAIDSSLNGGNGNIDSWWAAHKDEIHPANQVMLSDMKSGKVILATEKWMTSKPGYSYVHGDGTPRVVSRTITPTKISYANTGTLDGIWLDTKVAYSMKVTGGSGSGIQNSTGELSFALAKDPADGKWKIAGYDTNYHTAEG